MDRLKLFLLGAPRLELDGREVSMDTRKAIALLAYLAVTGQEQPRDVLADLFWPDDDQAGARGALRRTLSTLHKAMGSRGLRITREHIGIDHGAELWVDCIQFLKLASGCEGAHRPSPADCPECLDQWEEAAQFYQADFMAGFGLRDSPAFDDWQYLQGETLRRILAQVLERLANCLAFRTDFELAIQYAHRWCAMDPLREEAHRLLMLIYARSGRRNDALQQYREVVRTLDRELSVAPLEETTALYQEVLSGRILAANPQSFRTALPEGAGSSLQPASGKPLAVSTPFSPVGMPLVGRTNEWAALQSVYQAMRDPANQSTKGSFVSIEGEAGIGKTRLAEDFLAQVRAAGGIVLQSKAYEGENSIAYGPFADALTSVGVGASTGVGASPTPTPENLGTTLAVAPGGPAAAPLDRIQPVIPALPAGEKLKNLSPAVINEVARLVPGLAAAIGESGVNPTRTPKIGLADTPIFIQDDEGPAAQTRFYEALRQVFFNLLSGAPPGVLFLDDLHWADSASLDLLAYLAHRLPAAGILILAAWRSEDTPNVARLRQICVDARRAGAGLRLVLNRLNAAEVAELARSRLPVNRSLSRAVSQRLFNESEGLPFFAVEYLQSLDPGAETWEIPTGVRELIHQRLAAASETAHQLLSSAAVIGRSFEVATLQAVSGRSDLETVEGIEELEQRGILSGNNTAANIPSYDFTHAKLRDLAYHETSLARRRLLHLRAGEALSAPGRDRREVEAQAGMIAAHFQAAGQEPRAADYFRQAGEYARRLHANAEALVHYQAALAAGYAEPAVLHEALGDLHLLQGSYPAAIASYQAAASLCAQPHISILMHKLGEACHRRGEYLTAVDYYRAALEASGADSDVAFQAHLYADWSLTTHRLNQPEAAENLAETARQHAEASQDASALAQALNMLGILAHARDDLPQAAVYLESSLKAASSLENLAMRSAALNNLARVYLEQDRLEDALALSQQALETCIRLGDRHRQAALHNLLADIYHLVKREDEAMQQLELAVVLFSEIGEGVGRDQPEIWKLTEW